MNLVSIGLDGKPQQKGLVQILQEWITFRFETVTRRTKHRLAQVRARIHILEGRLAVFLNIDEVIRIIRSAEEPKQALAETFGLTEIQASDILEIRLRQLATLERIKIEGELAELTAEANMLEELLANRDKMTAQILVEIEADRKKFGDARRTLIEKAERITTTSVAAASDDPVTLIISKNGWLRARAGHKVDLSALTWKPGDEALAVFEARSNQTVAVMDSAGRAYNVQASAFPTGRGDGVPLSSLVTMTGKALHAFMLQSDGGYLLVNDAGVGFVCPATDLVTRQKAGKEVMTKLEASDTLLPPVYVKDSQAAEAEIAVAGSNGKLLVFPLAQVKVMPKAMGMQLMSLGDKGRIVAVTASSKAFSVLEGDTEPAGGRKQITSFKLTGPVLDSHRGQRARAGNPLPEKAIVLRMRFTEAGPPMVFDDGDQI
jgi:topoisomerase-4 subunit A